MKYKRINSKCGPLQTYMSVYYLATYFTLGRVSIIKQRAMMCSFVHHKSDKITSIITL